MAYSRYSKSPKRKIGMYIVYLIKYKLFFYLLNMINMIIYTFLGLRAHNLIRDTTIDTSYINYRIINKQDKVCIIYLSYFLYFKYICSTITKKIYKCNLQKILKYIIKKYSNICLYFK